MKPDQILNLKAGQKAFLLGNEAIARGAIEAGVVISAAYPGTPSSEITETLSSIAKKAGIYVEWSVNEKVAFEVALAGSLAGVRSMACMKHVGLNVAHDPVMTASYIGARGGLVLVAADDPWAWSSQNEQDNRYIARQAYIPILEPSSVQEAKDMTVSAFDLSEAFHHLFMLRPVTRVSHARGDVSCHQVVKSKAEAKFVKDRSLLVYTPTGARRNRPLMIKRFDQIREAVNELPFNQLALKEDSILGIAATGVSYNYVLEAVNWLGIEDRVSILKIGTPHPLPQKLVQKLLKASKKLLIVEELEPFVELEVKGIAFDNGLKVKIHGKDCLPVIGELSTRKVTEAISKLVEVTKPKVFTKIDLINSNIAEVMPARPPVLCPGCPHRASLYAVKIASRRVAKKTGKDGEPVFPGDIGCYTLAYAPPIESADTVICMGASFGIANGLSHVLDVPVVAHLGDSTFFHSGIPPLINAVFNQANITMVVLDNSATAMTGFQPHPGTGKTATGVKTEIIYPEKIARACGVKHVAVTDPFKLKEAILVLEKAIEYNGPSFVVMRKVCTQVELSEKRKMGGKVDALVILENKCNNCQNCIKLLGCPAVFNIDGRVSIDAQTCTGCGVCAQICPRGAIVGSAIEEN